MRRTLALLAHASGAVLRRRARSLVLLLALTVTSGASGAVFLLGESLRATSDALLDRAPRLTLQALVAGRPALLTEDDLERVRSIPSVRSVRPRVWGYLHQEALEGNIVILGMEPSELAAGRAAGLPEVLGEDEVVLGAAFARLLGFRRGDRVALALPGRPGAPEVLSIAAVLGADTEWAFGDAVIAGPGLARRLLAVPEGAAVDAVVEVFPPEEIGVVSQRIVDAVAGARLVEREALRRRRALTFEARSGLASAALLPLVLALLVLLLDRLSGLAEGERREIGILKAVGWSTADVLAARLFETAIVGVLGAGLGLALAYGYVFLLGAPGLAEALFGWSNVRPTALFVPAGGDAILLLLSVVLAPYLAASIVPAWRAAILDPDRAIREGS
jgi:ABC-type lipoprotein release transport system permease subunit